MSAAPDSYTEVVYVRLLDEGTDVLRPTRALPLGDSRYRLFPSVDYDPDIERWEFPPGSTVRCVLEVWEGMMVLVARAAV